MKDGWIGTKPSCLNSKNTHVSHVIHFSLYHAKGKLNILFMTEYIIIPIMLSKRSQKDKYHMILFTYVIKEKRHKKVFVLLGRNGWEGE